VSPDIYLYLPVSVGAGTGFSFVNKISIDTDLYKQILYNLQWMRL
jgi:hypothetical protein